MTFQMTTKIVWRAQILWQYRRADGLPPRFNADYIYVDNIKLLYTYYYYYIMIPILEIRIYIFNNVCRDRSLGQDRRTDSNRLLLLSL